jgi:hypothetical protein
LIWTAEKIKREDTDRQQGDLTSLLDTTGTAHKTKKMGEIHKHTDSKLIS